MEFLLWFLCPIGAGIIAGHKGRSALGWLCLGLFIGPFAFLVALLPSSEAQDEKAARKYGSWGALRLCPHCSEPIRKTATKCRYCQSEVAWPVIP